MSDITVQIVDLIACLLFACSDSPVRIPTLQEIEQANYSQEQSVQVVSPTQITPTEENKDESQ